MIEELLHWLGVPGSIGAIVSAGVMLFHGKHVLSLLARIGTWMRVTGVVAFLAVVLASGVVPGVELSIDIGTFWAWLSGVWAALPIEEMVQ
ncbi:hypothetical protein VB779_09310 [Haloarculaceae archaeon H-GB11]|nr:hypothetical protein [Haloarculaceae archaeon H-GB11]